MGEPISATVASVIKGIIKVIEEVRKTHELFDSEFQKLESKLQVLEPRVDAVRDFDQRISVSSGSDKKLAEVRRNEMNKLLQELKECDLLIRNCNKVPMWNICLIKVYAERLKEKNEYLHNFVSNMITDVWQISRTTSTGGAPIFSGSAVPEPPALTVGWVAPVEELKQKLLREDVSVMGIRGLGGCGKTTLAAKFCEQVKGTFYKISFLPISRTPNLLLMVSRLWRDLVSDVGKLPEFLNVDDAMNLLNDKLKEWKPERGMVLVVLDDVWSDPEVEKLVIRKPGFKTLVTTRMGLNWLDGSSYYDVPQLAIKEAERLFVHYACSSDQDPRRLNPRLVKQIVEGCMRLPLALEVMGASLKNQSDHWKFQQMATMFAKRGQTIDDLDKRILDRLHTSVEYLSDKQRECFMDFICFPGNKRIRAAAVMDMWVQIRGETELGARSILQQLSDRHLIELFQRRRNEVGDRDEGFSDLFITQHDLLAKLADSTSQKSKKTRLVINQTDELPDAELTSEAEIVTLDMGDGRRNLDTYSPPFPHAEVLILNFSNSSCSLPPFLKEMRQLKLLIVANHSSTAAELTGLPPSSYLKNLRSVRLEKISLPILHTFAEPFLGLQKLSMVLCEVREEERSPAFDIQKIFPEITEIEIDYCNGLERLPTSVYDVTNLKKLSITNCHDLMEFPEAVGRLRNLEVLRLRACTTLGILPDSISELKRLRFLNLSECSNISSLPETIEGLQGLETIDVRGCSARLPVNVRKLKGLDHVICDGDTARMWEPFLDYIKPVWLDQRKADTSLDFLR